MKDLNRRELLSRSAAIAAAGKELPGWTVEFDCKTWTHYAIRYVLSNPAMTALVTGTSKVNHVVDNMRAGYRRLPDEKMRQRMEAHLLSM